MKNILIFNADENFTLCLERICDDTNSFIVEAQANSFESPILQLRTNGGTIGELELTLTDDLYVCTIPTEKYINTSVSLLEIRIKCQNTDDCSEWIKIDTKITDTSKNVLLAEVSALHFETRAADETDDRTFLNAENITGKTLDLNDFKLNTADDKGKSKRYISSVVNSANITNRPIGANEPFELTVDNIRFVNTGAFNTVQRYTSVARKRSYTRWCDDGTWKAWKCDEDITLFGTVSAASPKTMPYTTYGEGFTHVEIEGYFDSATAPISNRKIFPLINASAIERTLITTSGGSSEIMKIDTTGNITISVTGSQTLSYKITYFNSR